jgi:muconolactone D-isomerase
MLYLVHMRVDLPYGMPADMADDIKAREKAYAMKLQEDGVWLHLWRVTGEYANYSVFDVEDHDRLHAVLSALPLFPYMHLQVTPLAKHPSSIR